MKKQLTAIIGILIIALSLSVQGAKANCDCTNTERGYITTVGSAETEMAPDTATMSISIQTYDNKSMIKASNENKEISAKVYTELKKMIDLTQNDTIKTTGYHAQPIYIYNNGKRNFDKYQVSNNILIKTKSISKVGKMIDKAVELGATEVNSISFSLSTIENEKNTLLYNATKNAKAQADTIAKAVGTTITGTKSVSVSYNNIPAPMLNFAMAGSAKRSAEMDIETPIETGTLKIKVMVNAEFFVK